MDEELKEPPVLGTLLGAVIGVGMAPLMFGAAWMDYNSINTAVIATAGWIIGLPLTGLWCGLIIASLYYSLEKSGY